MPRSPLARSFLRALESARTLELAEAGRPPAPALGRPLGRPLGRRRFLGLGAGALAASTLPLRPAQAGGRPRILIVGGGIAGLTAAFTLKQAGITADVYEGGSRLGGRILSVRNAVGQGLVTEFGGEFINTDHADMIRLCETFGLPLFNRIADFESVAETVPETAYFLGGVVVPEARLARDLRPLARRVMQDARRVDRNFDANAPEIDALSVAQYLDQIPDLDPLARLLVEATIRTEYGVEPDQSSALQLLSNLPMVDGQEVSILGSSDEALVIEGGNARLIEALEAALGSRIHRRKLLTRVQERREGGYRVFFDDGTVETADVVVLTLPPPALRRVRLDVSLRPRLARFLERVQLGLNEKVIAGFRGKPWRTVGAFAGETWVGSGFSQCWDATQRQPDQPLSALTFYLGGGETRSVGNNARLDGVGFIRTLESVVPGITQTATGRFVRTQWERNPLSGGGYSTFAPGELTSPDLQAWIEGEDGQIESEVRDGSLYFAGEHLSDAFYGFMNGGAETGRLAAQAILARVAAA